MTIQQTKTYGKLEPFQQELINKRANRLQIEEAVVTARTIGYYNWESITGLPSHWRAIVKEIVNS